MTTITNDYGVKIKKQCSSCQLVNYTVKGRECPRKLRFVTKSDVCEFYQLSNKFENVGKTKDNSRFPVMREYQLWRISLIDKFREVKIDGSDSSRVDWEAFERYMQSLGLMDEKGNYSPDIYNYWLENYKRSKTNRQYIDGYGM